MGLRPCAKGLIVDHYFADDQAAIDQIKVELESITASLTELEEEHGSEEGAFSELDKVNKANVAARLKEIKNDKEANLKRHLKNAEAAWSIWRKK